MNEVNKLLRIVTVQPDESGVTPTQGTRVFAGDTEIHGITRIEITAGVNDIWRARIDVSIQPPADLSALSVVSYPTRPERFLRWMKRG